MTIRYNKIPGAPGDGSSGPDSEPVPYNWFFDSALTSPLASPSGSQTSQGSQALGQTEASESAAPAPALPSVVGTPGADVFAVDIATLNAAVAVPPAVLPITGYSAAQGDVIDFSAILRGSYAPLTPDSTQLRVTEAASGNSATLDFNVGTAQHPHWVALAALDGVHAGDTIKVALDANHTVELHSAWLT